MPSAGPGLALFARARHVRHQLTRLVSGRAELRRRDGEVLLVGGELAPLLRELSEQLTSTQRLDVRAAPWDGERVDYAASASIEQWTERLESPWYGIAARALRFDLQAIAALDGGRMHGHEALVRAQFGRRELDAVTLLQAAAAHHQLPAFDARARRRAIVQAYPQLPPGTRLFLNFSPTVIYDPDLCLGATFRTCLDADVDMGRLVFSLTQAAAFPDLPLLRRIVDRLREQGARVALNNMDSGQTSLAHLSALRPDYVKLDRGLLGDLSSGDPRLPHLAAMIRHAHELGVLVIAAGIETAEALQILRELGADFGQGYFLARPCARPCELSPAARGVLTGLTTMRRPDPTRRACQGQRVPVEF